MALTGGYENELVEPLRDVQWDCPICLLIVREPQLVSCCGLRFCRSCIEQIQRRGHPCPHCQTRFAQVVPDAQLNRLLLHKRVYCINKDAGCQWAGGLKEAEKHVRVDCMRTEVACPNQCGQHILRCSLNQHATEECPRRPRLCEFAAMGCDSGALTPDRLHNHMQWSVQKHLTLVCKKLEETKIEAQKMHESETRAQSQLAEVQKRLNTTNLEAHKMIESEAKAQSELAEIQKKLKATKLEAQKMHESEARAQSELAEMLQATKLEAQKMLELEAKQRELEARIQDRDVRIRQLEATVEDPHGRIEELETQVQVQKALIRALYKKVETHITEIHTLAAEKQDHEMREQELKVTVADLEAEVKELEANVQTHEARAEEFKVMMIQVRNLISLLLVAVLSLIIITKGQLIYEQYISRGQTKDCVECCDALMVVNSDTSLSFVVMVSTACMSLSRYKKYILYTFIVYLLCLYAWVLFGAACFYCLTPFMFSFGSNLSYYTCVLCTGRCVNKGKRFLIVLAFCVYMAFNTSQRIWFCHHY